eukprot:3941201-Rhodomonas_salina.7
MSCPVLTYGPWTISALRTHYAMSGTDRGLLCHVLYLHTAMSSTATGSQLWCYWIATRCPVLTRAMLLPDAMR